MMMRELAEFTRVNPKERIIRYNKFMNRLLTTPKVNKYLLIHINTNLFTFDLFFIIF